MTNSVTYYIFITTMSRKESAELAVEVNRVSFSYNNIKAFDELSVPIGFALIISILAAITLRRGTAG